jgi:hypothetical protein
MKKLLIILYVLGPILGFMRATFLSDSSESRLQLAKGQAHVQFVTYRPQGPSKAITLESLVIYKSPKSKYATLLFINSEGFIEKSDLANTVEFDDFSVILNYQGSQATDALAKIESAIKKYPFVGENTGLLGPNNNTFTAYLLRQLQSDVELPSNAMGKDYLGDSVRWLYLGKKNLFIGSIGGYVSVFGSDQKAGFSILGLSLGYNWKENILSLPGLGDIYLQSLKQD